jgi:uncharacterized protein (TIGR02145 family)
MSRFGLFILVLLSFSSLFSQIPSYVPTNGLVGWWPFNGNANDESGNGNNGTVNGATLTTDRNGLANKAYSFDGVDDFIQCGEISLMNNASNWSIFAWVKVSDFNSWINCNDGCGMHFVSRDRDITASHFSLPVVQNVSGGTVSLYFKTQISSENIVVPMSQWIQLGLRKTNSTIDFLVNGNMVSTFSDNSIVGSSNGILYFGKHFGDGFGNYLYYTKGKLDDIGIWNRALTPQEISNLYNAGPFDVSASSITVCAGQPTTLSVQSVSGNITALNCASATNTGTLTAGTAAGGVSASVPYTGGNGGAHNGQTVTSTGVTGLTATLTSGTFASGNGSLTYTITGTPSASGTASFVLNIGGQTCLLNINVYSVQPAYPSGSVFCAFGSTIVNDVTNPTTGKTWMDRNLGANNVANSMTDVNAYGDLYQWGRRSDGHQCRSSAITSVLSSTSTPNHGDYIISPNLPEDWLNPQNINLWQGVNGLNNPCPIGYRLPTETELNDERLSWSSNSANGAFASPLKFTMSGGRSFSDGSIGSIGFYGRCWTSTISSTKSRGMVWFNNSGANMDTDGRADGYSVRCIKEIAGSIGSLNCGSSTNTGTLTSGTAASGVSSSVPYSGGNGGTHNGQTVTSTGVTGLTATLAPGNFATGAGSLVYTISGTPNSSGTASFALNIGGQTCTLTRTVNLPVGTITALSCGTATNTGTLTSGTAASGVSSSVPYTGGNGGTHNGQTVASTGVTGLTATLAAGTFAVGAGNLTYTITGTPSASGTASFALNIGGKTCTLTRTVNLPVGTIATLSCGTATNAGTLTSGTAASGVSSSVPYTGGNGGTHNGQTVTSTGVTGLTATLAAGTFAVGAGNLTYTITGTPSASGTASFALNIGGKTCTLTRTVNLPVGTITTLSCGTATNAGTLTSGSVASGVSSSVPYTGGNGGTHNGQTVASTGVTGLTATLAAGTFAVGAGSLTYTITGTPSAPGTASFALNIGGKTCTLTRTVNYAYPTGTVNCTGSPTAVVIVTNPTTGKQWMDRNLGATQVATSSTDANAYGDLYQWGRRADGHQCRTSATTTTLSSVDQPAHGNFILAANSPNDWRSPQNTNLWQGVNGINNPCPIGFRLPTQTELNSELTSFSPQNSTGAYSSPLKLTLAGRRINADGALFEVGVQGQYWSSTVSSTYSYLMYFGSGGANMGINLRGSAFSVRCIKN